MTYPSESTELLLCMIQLNLFLQVLMYFLNLIFYFKKWYFKILLLISYIFLCVQESLLSSCPFNFKLLLLFSLLKIIIIFVPLSGIYFFHLNYYISGYFLIFFLFRLVHNNLAEFSFITLLLQRSWIFAELEYLFFFKLF